MKNTLREITLEGCFNFRDLGGYRTESGQRVKVGMLYRSGNLSQLTENDVEKLRSLGIRKICDLRGDGEVTRYPDPELEGATWYHTPVLSDEKMMGQVGDETSFIDALRETKPGEMLLDLNKNMVTFKSAFQHVMKVVLSEPRQPLLFHCMAGKDRTGAVAAILLGILGVPREQIVEDYLYTNHTLEQMNQHFDDIGYNHLPGIEQDVLDALFEARAEYINTFLDEVEAHYESMERFVKHALGLSDEDIRVLREHLLEDE
ncbi:tyrosine-protein phosphatase [Salirhabdus sp. Marseille-P4669]|uniref:tyrosine-protein phosphatase n=1 Tax=Salirhabdus sp. Marseille-P4669 TaxID=2042310 RepID=UPI000C7C9093|nr:tyrosine-protein phosphatase [Salirhabdus sp. Marseille-P4669]